MAIGIATLERKFSEEEVLEQNLIPGATTRVTLWRLRQRKQLGFFRINSRIFYSESQITEFIAACERKAKTKK